jgi:hypothetical protein
MDFEVYCLQMHVETSAQSIDLSVDYDAAFDMKALADGARVEAGAPQEIWEQCMAGSSGDAQQRTVVCSL